MRACPKDPILVDMVRGILPRQQGALQQPPACTAACSGPSVPRTGVPQVLGAHPGATAQESQGQEDLDCTKQDYRKSIYWTFSCVHGSFRLQACQGC